MFMKRKEITFDRFVRIMAVIVGLVLTYLLLDRLSGVLLPFLIAWLMAYMLFPIVLFFQHKCRLKSRALSIVVTLLVVLGCISGALYCIVPPVVEESVRLKNIAIDYLTHDGTIKDVTDEMLVFVRNQIDINKLLEVLTVDDVTTFVEKAVPKMHQIITSSFNMVVGVVCSLISLIYMFFILMDYEEMSVGIIKMVPPSRRGIVKNVLSDVERGMNGYFRGQSLIAFLVGIMFSIGFMIIGLPLAIPLGLFIGLLNLVPYLQTLGLVPTIVLALLKAHDTGTSFWSIMLAAFIVFAVVQSIQDWFLTPRIMGKVTGMKAAIILLSLSVWGSLLGFVGLIIALPLTSLLASYYKRYVIEDGEEQTEVSQQTPGDTNP